MGSYLRMGADAVKRRAGDNYVAACAARFEPFPIVNEAPQTQRSNHAGAGRTYWR